MAEVAPAGDAIAAIATPPGRGAIGIVRLSGAGVAGICRRLTGKLPAPRTAALCDFLGEDGAAIDRGLALYFPAPGSYTGEDGLELHAHGGAAVLRMLLRRCVQLGARPARPGEFSERAFLNGKLDLAQAEAVADLIAGDSEAAAKAAMRSLQGEFSRRVNELTAALTELRVSLEAAIDFPEESVDAGGDDAAKLAAKLTALQARFAELRAAAGRGAVLRDGLKVVLTGPPNAGKSSLMNALAGQSRAIVNARPGTTRDLLQTTIEVDGVAVELTDSAGIRDSGDEVEAEGVRRAKAAQAEADLVLLVVDDAAAGEEEVAEWKRQTGGGRVCLVRNKIDLSGRVAGDGGGGGDIAVSALHGDGLEVLRARLLRAGGFVGAADSLFSARARHLDALTRASGRLDSAADNLPAFELAAEELRVCQECLGEISGEVSSDALLGMIFAEFCIGK